jgi:NADPH:quinone reductase-like Zn-dependent oxidoreductase
LSGGGYAELVTVPEGQVLNKPKGLSFNEAAALPEVFATAYLNLYMEGKLKDNETALIHAGASGVGTAAIQICKVFNNPCFVTAGNKEKIARCIDLGASGGLVRSQKSFTDEVLKWTSQKGVDVILDPVGASYLEDNLNCLSLEGRLIIIGLMGGAQSNLKLGQLLMKRARIFGSTLRALSIESKTRIMNNLEKDLWPFIEEKKIKPIIDSIFPYIDTKITFKIESYIITWIFFKNLRCSIPAFYTDSFIFFSKFFLKNS